MPILNTKNHWEGPKGPLRWPKKEGRVVARTSSIGTNKFKEQLDKFLTNIPDQSKIPREFQACLTVQGIHSNLLADWIPLILGDVRWQRHGN